MAFICRVRTVLNGWAGAPGLSTHYYTDETAGIPSLAAVENMLSHVRDGWYQMSDSLSNQQSAQVSSVVDVLETSTGVLATQLTGTAQAIVVGAGSALVGPAAAGLSLNFSTSTIANGRVVRGRSFISPIGAGSDANGSPTAVQIASALDMGTALLGSGTPVIIQVIWHRPVSGAGGVAAPVVGHSVSDRFAILRSRRG